MVLSTASMMGKNSEKVMAKYKCIRGVVTSQGVANVGDIVELSEREAKAYGGKFIAVKDEPAPVRVAEAPEIEHRDPVIEAPRRGRPRGR
jgi:hypothetical protein